jgi:hypothetical protein
MTKRINAMMIALSLLLTPALARAEDNPLIAYRQKVAQFINELTTTGLFILPLAAGLAIVVVAVLRAIEKGTGGKNLNDHDDRIKSILGYLVVGESAVAFVAIVSFFFK